MTAHELQQLREDLASGEFGWQFIDTDTHAELNVSAFDTGDGWIVVVTKGIGGKVTEHLMRKWPNERIEEGLMHIMTAVLQELRPTVFS